MPQDLIQLDISLFFLLNIGIQNLFFDLVMPFITNKWPLIALPFVVFLFFKGKKDGDSKGVLAVIILSVISALIADGASNIIKHLAERVRPCNTLENVHLLVGCTKSFSMPSNHAANAFAFAIPFVLMSGHRLRYVFLFIAAAVGFSRVYVGVHYPSDVVAGAITGTLISLSSVYMFQQAKKRYADKPYTTVMSVSLLLLSLFRIYYILHGPLHLSPDEAHYWEWSRRLDLSYYSKGPAIAYLIAFGTSVFGDNVFGIRILAVVFSLLSSLFLFKLGKGIYNERTGAYSAIIFQIIPLYSPFGVIFTIDSPFLFFWILSLYLFWKALNKGKEHGTKGKVLNTDSSLVTRHSSLIYWLLLGISAGLGMLTKYTMAFFYICVLLFIVFSPERRGILKSPYPYIAFLLSIAVFSPVIVWNAQHDWVTLRHTSGQAHISEGFRISLVSFFEFIASQIGVLTPILSVMILIALLRQKTTKTDDNGIKGKRQFLFWFSMPVIVFFVLKSLQGKVQANWAMTGYITGIIAFSKVFLDEWVRRKKAVKTLIIAGLSLSFLLASLSHYPAKLHIPLKLDPSARLRGWEQLGREVSIIYSDMLTKGNLFLFSDRYQVSGELAFYVTGNPVVYCANTGSRMNQYNLWPGFHNLIHYNAIFVTIGDTELPAGIRDAFTSSEKQVFRVYEKDRVLREYSIFICHDFKGMREERIERY